MELYVLAADQNNPIVGETLPDGTQGFDDESYYQPKGYAHVDTDAGQVIIPIFGEKKMVNHDALTWFRLDEFLDNKLILKVNGFDRTYLKMILSSDTEELYELVHDAQSEMAVQAMNATDDENEQEEILKTFERRASDINNKGLEEQILYLLCA